MNLFAVFVMLVWPPVVVMLYNILPRKKSVGILFVAGWLFLPVAGFVLPGLPDYTKSSATVGAVLFCTVLFDSGKLLAFRPRRFDLPMLIWCSLPFVSALANGLAPYDGIALVLDQLVQWGLPYLIGRLYLTDAEDLKELAVAVALGGIVYIPFCLFESRFSPILSFTFYGLGTWEGFRMGGYRPRVFFANGLSLGSWMMTTCLMACVLYWSRTIRALQNISFGWWTLALLGTTVMCKSTGGIILAAFGIAAYRTTLWSRRTLVMWLVVAIPPVYCVVRGFDLWSGQDIVEVASQLFGPERADSLDYRLKMERILADHAMERPILGWAGFGRNLILASDGQLATVPDGYWVIALGIQGIIGLFCLLLLMIRPMAIVLWRYPIATWRDPTIGPIVGLALMLLMMMIDCLSNAMLTPILPLAIGGVFGYTPHHAVEVHDEAEEALAVAAECTAQGRMGEAVEEFHRAIALTSGVEDASAWRVQAEAFDGLGQSLLASGRAEEAIDAFREALVFRDELAAENPDEGHFRDLAIARDGLGRALAESGRAAEAVEERRLALELWGTLASDRPKDSGLREHLVDTLNDLAWLLATDPGLAGRDPSQALDLAEEAVRIAPGHDASWNTLGVARYRAGDWAGAIEALERSALTGPDGVGTAFDHYFLAMAWSQLQRDDQAEEWLERGNAWAARHQPGHPGLKQFRLEAESLLADEQGGTTKALT